MKNSFSSFFKLVFYELKKLWRSPIILAFLILGPILMQLCVGLVVDKTSVANITQTDQDVNQNISYVKNGDLEQGVQDALKEYVGEGEIAWTENLEDAIVNLKLKNTLMVLFVDANKEPQEIQIYYDPSNILSSALATNTQMLQEKYAYVTVINFLESYFVSVDESYFHLATFNSVLHANLYTQSFPGFFAIFLAFVLMVGVSFSIARDNETQVFKQLCYTPLSTNKYLLVKGVLYVAIGIIDVLTMLLVSLIFGFNCVGSVWLFLLYSLLFILSFIAMNMFFSTTKNQISSISLTLLFILVPIIVGMQFSLNNLPVALQILLLVSPLTSFLEIAKTHILFGVCNYIYIIIMAVQMIVYYVLAVAIIKHKTGIRKRKKA